MYGNRVLLADRQDDVIARQQHFPEHALADDLAVLELVLEFLEQHAGQLAGACHYCLRRMVDEDRDAFTLGVLELPFGSLEELARLARHEP